MAVAVPVLLGGNDSSYVAACLQAVLKGGAQAIGCDAAALYMLDEGTTQLKLRSAWGLPRDRFTDPARPLAGATADLEALLGHAVVLGERMMHEGWNVPEPFESAVCVPVSGPMTPLGTLWMFCNQQRDYSGRETNLVEIIAGRLASDLEREMLLAEGAADTAVRLSVDAAARQVADQFPPVAPVLEGWDIAGGAHQANPPGGAFCDWFAAEAGAITLAAGRASASSVCGAMTASAVRASLRTASGADTPPAALVDRVSDTLWRCSAGEQTANVATALLDHRSGDFHLSGAGGAGALIMRARSWESLRGNTTPIGMDPGIRYEQHSGRLEPGDMLILLSDTPSGVSQLARALAQHTTKGAAAVLAVLDDLVETGGPESVEQDHAALVVSRRKA